MFPARRCLLPQPGEVAGLAERLSPSKALMSPSEQTKRIIRSPTLLHNTVTSDSVSPNSFTLSSARRRQLNIRSFLQAISPPNSSTSSPHSLAANIGSLRTRGAATLTETLGGVVQRFPAISVGLQLTSISSNLLPDHSTDVTPRNQTDPAPRKTRLSLSPDSFYSDSSDIENQFTSPARPPLEYADVPTFTNFSATHSDFEKTPLTPETPPSHRSRPPLIMRQVLFHTPTQLPFCESETLRLSHKRLEPNSPTESPSSRFDPELTSPALICKRRRLTVCPAVHCRSVTGSPTMQKVAPRRRVTTVGQRFKPITSYLKSDK
ncbi:unnamed protein product [Dicrocoelium dendriticum]|nr:unnamed protein product [Dicrocoelium dendriticum]